MFNPANFSNQWLEIFIIEFQKKVLTTGHYKDTGKAPDALMQTHLEHC